MSSSLSTSSLFPLTQSQGTLESLDTGTATSSSSASIRNTKKPVDFPTNSQGEQQHLAAPTIELPENSRIIEPGYLSKHANKKDLIRKLRNVVQVLRHDETIEAESSEWPGLAGISQYIVTNFLNHADKEVRLYAVLACMEIFTIYAPEVPWDRQELIDIFQQTVRQLGNLAHTTDPTKQPNFSHYAHILELFAQVKIGCVIVDLAQQEGTDIVDEKENNKQKRLGEIDEDDDLHSDSDIESLRTPKKQKKGKPSSSRKSTSASHADKTTPLEVVVDLIHTLLHCVRNEHPVEILEMVQQAITACLEEYNPDHGAPIPINVLDELLLCIGQGPTVWVINAVAHQQLSQQQQPTTRAGGKASKKSKAPSPTQQQAKLPLQVEQTNPTYVIASAVVRCMLNKLATPVAQLLNGLLNGDSFILEQSSIRCPSSSSEGGIDQSPNAYDPANVSDNVVDVYAIVYELHRVAPQVLTTVIGTVSNGLRSPDTAKRAAVTNLMGRLFSATPNIPTASNTTATCLSASTSRNYSSATNMASEFRACYREWLGRSNDVESLIRIIIVKHCVAILRHSTHFEPMISQEASETVTKALNSDPNLDVRLEGIHQVSDWIYRQSDQSSKSISPSLVRSIGGRCSSKHKQERRDAVTGLAKIYAQKYMAVHLKSVIAGGDDCPVSLIQDVLRRTCQLEDRSMLKSSPASKRRRKGGKGKSIDDASGKNDSTSNEYENDDERYGWIPSKVFECLCYTNQTDPEMRNRVVQIIDDVLLGSTSKTDKATSSKSVQKMTPTSSAIGLTMILDSLNATKISNEHLVLLTSDRLNKSNVTNAFKFMHQFLATRSKLQKTISSYIDIRATIRECEAGSEEAMAAEVKAMELLEAVASICASTHHPASSPTSDDVLTSFHGARDKHIFRILATITDPVHTMQARARALDELPKRTKSLGNGVSEWIRDVVKKCAMSDFLNYEIVNHCAMLAQECFKENDVSSTAAFLTTVKTAVEIFPALGASDETFVTLTELFADCRVESNKDVKAELESFGVVTGLSSILSIASTAQPMIVGQTKNDGNTNELQSHLLKLVTQDGTPEQARNAVYTLSRLLINGSPSDDATANSSAKSTQSSADEKACQDLTDAFNPLLTALTSPSKLKVCEGSSRIVSTLAALSALVDCVPFVMGSAGRGQKAFKFALETVLMGRHQLGNDHGAMEGRPDGGDSEESEDDEHRTTPTSSSRKRATSNSTPEAVSNLLENEELSVHCRRICASIDFLVSHIRSTMLEQIRRKSSKLQLDSASALSPSEADIDSVFQILIKILRDKGLPPSSRDRKHCKARHDRAALRQCVAVHILRLSDSRLGLEKKFLSPSMWHVFCEACLDEERVVRETVLAELSEILIGSGIYGWERSKLAPKAPSLRFLALITLCSDGDHGIDNDMANGSAANVGKAGLQTKNSALQCIINLRKVADASYAHCRAMGKAAEAKFETQFKMLLVPEYAVPYAFHLLSHRRETPNAGATAASSEEVMNTQDDSPTVVNDESQQRVLRKRLKLLFEPLIHSLGEGADNISFLLRMTEILGKHYKPVDACSNLVLGSAKSSRLSINSAVTSSSDDGTDSNIEFNKARANRSHLLEAKLVTICAAAREVLLSFVKKDVNLCSYPGTIQLPATLFARTDRGSVRILPDSEEQSQQSEPLSPASGDDDLPGNEKTPENRRISGQILSKSSLSAPETRHKYQQGRTTRAGLKSKSSHFPELQLTVKEIKSPTRKVGSSRRGRVHFSPDLVDLGTSSPRRISERSNNDRSFDNLSPIVKPTSPGSVQFGERNSCSPATLGATPPSASRNHPLCLGSLDCESGDKELPCANSTDHRSPIVLREVHVQLSSSTINEGDGTNAQSQGSVPLSSQSSKLSRHSAIRKRRRSGHSGEKESNTNRIAKAQESEEKSSVKRNKQASTLPKQIKLNRVKLSTEEVGGGPPSRMGRRIQDADEFEFDMCLGDENQPTAKNRIVTKNLPSVSCKPSKTPTERSGKQKHNVKPALVESRRASKALRTRSKS